MLAFLAALGAALCFVLGVIVPDLDDHNYPFWLMLGLMFAAIAAALHLLHVRKGNVP